MDFIARAGGIVQRANVVAGILLLLLVIMSVFTLSVMGQNAKLKQVIVNYADNQRVYVVPGSTAGLYAPRQIDGLLYAFADHVTQSLLTFTYASLEKQYFEIRRFFTPSLLETANVKYAQTIAIAKQDERSSLFIPQRESLKVERVLNPKDKTRYLDGVRKVTMIGTKRYFLGGGLIEPLLVRVTMEVRETSISQANPFGFVLSNYKEEELSAAELDVRGEL